MLRNETVLWNMQGTQSLRLVSGVCDLSPCYVRVLIVNFKIVCRTNVKHTEHGGCQFVLMTYTTATKNSPDSWHQQR